MRKAGVTYAEIAKIVGFATEGGARKTVRIALENIAQKSSEEAAEVRVLELQRLDGVLRIAWSRAVADKSMEAIDRVLKIIERRSKLLGLDAPKRTELTGLDGGPLQTQAAPPGPDLSKLTDEQLERFERITREYDDLIGELTENR